MLAVLIPPLVELLPFLDPSPGVIIALVMPPAIASMGGFALTFFPPAHYRRWIARRFEGPSRQGPARTRTGL
ncbi:MAG: hypothetical protein CL910_06045 [Deltaproteobacteria bacterium]|jgi:hypothetical protein|nr:hypothetical protein [Deltaproteobacteria bacterium]